jgi:uncharacterized protein involved in exopolysaccharide biosynthesis
LTSVYQEHLATAYEKSTGSTADQLRDSAQALDEQVAAKRQEVEAFRSTSDIVSTERDENQLLSAAKGLATALNKAKGKLAAAEGQLRAVRNAAAAGQGLVVAKDNPTVADLERRASQMREELHDLLQRFTPQYLDLDPDAKAKRARLANLEQQIKTERAASQRAAVAEAEGKVTAAREAVDQLQEQINDNKGAAQTFMARCGEYKAMQEDLTHLEQLHRAAADRLARLEASDSEVAPRWKSSKRRACRNCHGAPFMRATLASASAPRWHSGSSLFGWSSSFPARNRNMSPSGSRGGRRRSDGRERPPHLPCSQPRPPACRHPIQHRVN